MAFFRIYPSKDTSIANYDPELGSQSISASNVGASEILNLYKCAENAAEAQVLIGFDLAGLSPPSGSSVVLKMFDAQHSGTLPYGYTAWVRPVEQYWVEGTGHDMDTYSDIGPASDAMATLTSSWVPHTGVLGASFDFQSGHEDLEVDVSALLSSSLLGFNVYISQSVTGTDALYIKKFHSRQTHFPTKKPYLEVRWADFTGSVATEVKFHVTASGPWSGSYVDPWNTDQSGGELVTVTSSLVDPTGMLDFSLYDLKPVYDQSEETRLHLRVSPTIWDIPATLSASSETPGAVLTKAYYRIVDVVTDEVLVPFDSGALSYTQLSYDNDVNFFDIYMSSLPTGTLLKFDFEYEINGFKTFIPGNDFTFRIR